MSEMRLLHAGAWLAWLGAVLAVTSTTRNPWYLALLLVWVGVVTAVATQRSRTLAQAGWDTPLPTIPVWRFAIVAIPLAAIFNALFVHAGDTVLFRLPTWLPVIGGVVTVEALLYGALSGVVLIAIFAAFLLFNQVTPVRDLIRLAPRAYYPVAITVAIAITWVPVTLRQAVQIREAQAIRGSTLKGVRGWLPLFLPLVSGGLERAMMLAEAMVARGFAAVDHERADRGQRLVQTGLVAGLLLVLAGWLLRLAWAQPVAGATLLLGGILLLLLSIWQAGRATVRSEYRPAPWGADEWIVVACAAMTAIVFLLPIPGMDRSSLYYTPYPALALPDFSPLLGAALWGLLAPAVILLLRSGGESPRGRTQSRT